MPKYCGKQIFAHGRFPEVGQKQNTERKKESAHKNESDKQQIKLNLAK